MDWTSGMWNLLTYLCIIWFCIKICGSYRRGNFTEFSDIHVHVYLHVYVTYVCVKWNCRQYAQVIVEGNFIIQLEFSDIAYNFTLYTCIYTYYVYECVKWNCRQYAEVIVGGNSII